MYQIRMFPLLLNDLPCKIRVVPLTLRCLDPHTFAIAANNYFVPNMFRTYKTE